MDAKKRRCLGCVLWNRENLSWWDKDQFEGEEENSDVTPRPRGGEFLITLWAVSLAEGWRIDRSK